MEITKLIKSKPFLKLLLITIGIIVILVTLVLWRFGGNLTGKSGQQLTKGFPASPVYPNAVLKTSQKTTHYLGDFSYHGTWETSDSVPTVVAWYLKKLPNEGWFIDDYPADKKAENVQFLDAHKEKQIIQVSVIRDKGAQTTKVIIEYPVVPPESES
jgi:hypothetical protein